MPRQHTLFEGMPRIYFGACHAPIWEWHATFLGIWGHVMHPFGACHTTHPFGGMPDPFGGVSRIHLGHVTHPFGACRALQSQHLIEEMAPI